MPQTPYVKQNRLSTQHWCRIVIPLNLSVVECVAAKYAEQTRQTGEGRVRRGGGEERVDDNNDERGGK